MPDQHVDYDSPWKEILERYFEDFMRFFFPSIHSSIDWLKGYNFLDKELQLTDTIEQFEEEHKMQYVTSFERKWIQQGLQQGEQQGELKRARKAISDVLKARVDVVPLSVLNKIENIDSLTGLEELLTKAATIESIEEFQEILKKILAPV